MPTVQINGNTIHYTDTGSGKPVILLHGYPLDSRIWDGQVDVLAERYRVIAPDFAGFGRSTAAKPFTIPSMANDIRQLATELGALPCAVAGLSMGGYVALAWVKLCPTDIKALMIVDSKPQADSAEARQNRNRMIELAGTGGASAIADQMLKSLLTPQTLSNDPQMVQRLRQIIEDQPVQTLQWAQAAMRDREDLSDFVTSIADPTLILVGEKDPLTTPEMARALHATVSQSRLAIIPEAGHLPTLERPRETAEAMRRFLDECY